MRVIWRFVYWGNLIQGSFVTKFYQRYWVSGHFSMGSKVKATCKNLMIRMIAGLVFLSLIGVLGYYMIKDEENSKEQFQEYAKMSMLLMSNIYGTVVLVILLSYGLAFMPFSIWKRSNNSQLVY